MLQPTQPNASGHAFLPRERWSLQQGNGVCIHFSLLETSGSSLKSPNREVGGFHSDLGFETPCVSRWLE